jgi:hypothetical protein
VTGLFAFVSFVIACVIFALIGLEKAGWDAAWGFFFISLGLALGCLGGAAVWVNTKRS